MRGSWRAYVGVCVLVLFGSAAAAQALAPDAIREARHALRAYDTEGFGTTDVIARLGAAAREVRHPADRREARYLRAVAATDLLVVAERTGDLALRARVAEALGTREVELEQVLRRELASLTFGAYGQSAQDARAALGILEAMRTGEPPTFDGETGLRSDVLYLSSVRVAAREGRLAELGDDPCAVDGGCEPPYALFDADTRRAADALRRAGAAIERVERAAELGDPLAVALREAITEDRVALELHTVRGTPRRVDQDMPAVDGSVPRRAPDAVVVVTAREVRWAWVPAVRLGDGGEPVAVAPPGPALPDLERIELPARMRPALLPIDAVSRAFERIRAADPDAVVAVGAAADAPGHVLARVLMSLQAAELDGPLLAGIGPDGTLRGIPMRVTSERDPGYRRANVRVRVRLGGYSLHTPAGFQDIPRVRDAEERLRFDVGTLRAGARGVRYESAEVSFMSAVDTGPLLSAAFTVAPEDGPLTIALP